MQDQKQGRISEEYQIQDKEYEFPYHYIPYFDSNEKAHRLRILNNGLEYLCYAKHVVDIVNNIDKNQKVLEVGCGDGKIMNLLANKEAIGVDLSEKAIVFAKAFNPELEFLLGDAGDLEDTFDVLLAIEVLEHIPDKISSVFWKTMYDRLNLGGKLIISVPSVNKPLIKKHFRHYNMNVIENEIKSANLTDNFKLESSEYVYSENRLVRLWKRFSNNKYWTLEIHLLKNYIWEYIWKNLRISSEDKGLHLVVVLEKVK